jgi:hypothetical protein
MGVVVFMIGSASGELDGLFSVGEVSEEVIVEELAAVITIKAEDGEREVFFDVLDLFQDTRLALSPYCPLLCPAGSDINEVNGIGVQSLRGIAAMSDRIGFEESRT